MSHSLFLSHYSQHIHFENQQPKLSMTKLLALLLVLMAVIVATQSETLTIGKCDSKGNLVRRVNGQLEYLCCGNYRFVASLPTARCQLCAKAREGCLRSRGCTADTCCAGLTCRLNAVLLTDTCQNATVSG